VTRKMGIIAEFMEFIRLDLTSFILRAARPQARAVITDAEKLRVSERDLLRVLDLLENPPEPPPRLNRAAKAERADKNNAPNAKTLHAIPRS
jgi:uncharacterized protein (DUF1778 family)